MCYIYVLCNAFLQFLCCTKIESNLTFNRKKRTKYGNAKIEFEFYLVVLYCELDSANIKENKKARIP